ncbi:hypothetical protein D2T31_15930 [Sinirhodobacter populi]|uniref:VPLPA-CTERM sorting domain-containing protein n=1 Tax=Paenirhodobacter populi TaxID=2306993 RepID=A0A443K4M6_9RHOB|nr:hypothetical protein [Sinirhodobacter populi]RWR27721.1 hypothetical protein D2T31_15930 [Sinirhodobacter populi]
MTNNGAGVLPGVTWYTGNHTNENTLFWATGAGSELFYDEVVGYDSTFAALIGPNADGAYIQNTAVYDVIARANGLGDEALPAVPVPAPVLMLGGALVALFGMSRRQRT